MCWPSVKNDSRGELADFNLDSAVCICIKLGLNFKHHFAAHLWSCLNIEYKLLYARVVYMGIQTYAHLTHVHYYNYIHELKQYHLSVHVVVITFLLSIVLSRSEYTFACCAWAFRSTYLVCTGLQSSILKGVMCIEQWFKIFTCDRNRIHFVFLPEMTLCGARLSVKHQVSVYLFLIICFACLCCCEVHDANYH